MDVFDISSFLWFLLIQKAEGGLKKVSDGNMQIVENKHILAYGECYHVQYFSYV